MVYNLSSIDNMIASLDNDYNIYTSDHISRVPQWVGDMLQLMEIGDYLQEKLSPETSVINHNANMPCDIELLNYILYEGYWLSRRGILTKPMHNGTYMRIHPVESYKLLGDGRIETTFESGTIQFSYKGIPTDKKGFPLIPDNGKVKSAIKHYIILRLLHKGYNIPNFTIPELENKLFGTAVRGIAANPFNLVAQAKNSIARGDLDERRMLNVAFRTIIAPKHY